jgi:thioredoxin-related protein
MFINFLHIIIPLYSLLLSHIINLPNDLKRDTIDWKSFEAVENDVKENPRMIFIEVYTDWCKWCKKLDNEVLTDSTIIGLLNENYYALRLNGEEKKSIRFFNQEFRYHPITKTHELARALLGEDLSYPAIVILNTSYEIEKIIGGFQTKEELTTILKEINKN